MKELFVGRVLKRLISLAVGLSLIATSLSGCASGNTVIPNTHLNVAQVGQIATLNSDSLASSENKIAGDLAALTLQNFYEVDKTGSLVANKTFGKVEVTKETPFTVTYTFAKTALWSDGSSLDATDLALAVTAAKNQKFKANGQSTSLALASIVGTPKPGTNSLSITFENPISDWKTALRVAVPAHVVGKEAGLTGNVATLRAGVISALYGTDKAAIDKLASAYSSAFGAKSVIDNFLTNGAYTVSKVSETSIELKAVRDFGGLHPAVVETVFIDLYPDNASAFAAVGKSKVDIFSPLVTLSEPQFDLVSQSQTLSTKKFKVLAPNSNLSEQFLLNLSVGPFAEATYPDPKTAATLRQAFLNIVPKARANDFAAMTQVISRSDSFVYGSISKNYSAVAGSNGSANFLLQDVEKASELISDLKLSYSPRVRVLFDTDNPAAVAEWTLLSDHASLAGFRLTNVSSADPKPRLEANTFDVFLGAQPLFGSGRGSVQQLVTGPNRMPLEQFAQLTADLASATEKSLPAKLQALDAKLFEAGIGLPMYQLPSLLIVNLRVKRHVADPLAANSTWGYWTWEVSPDK